MFYKINCIDSVAIRMSFLYTIESIALVKNIFLIYEYYFRTTAGFKISK